MLSMKGSIHHPCDKNQTVTLVFYQKGCSSGWEYGPRRNRWTACASGKAYSLLTAKTMKTYTMKLALLKVEKSFFNQIMWQCGIQRKIVCGQARRTEPSTLQFTEHLDRIFI